MIIGLTIVAMGTSAPEAAVSITSSLAGQNEMCVANVVGSNIFNILFVLGLSVIISPIDISIFAFIDIVFMLMITLILYYFIRKSNSLDKKQGILFIIIYISYMTYTIIR